MPGARRFRIHILGASGSGTTTLARALARRLTCPQFDTDDYYWLPTDPPFSVTRERAARQALLGADLSDRPEWVLSGSLCGWGDVFIPLFDLVVYLWLPPAVRLARLRERERERYGADAIAPGGRLREKHTAFMDWAAAYDAGGLEIRSRALHEQWLRDLACPVVRITDVHETEGRLELITRYLSAADPRPAP